MSNLHFYIVWYKQSMQMVHHFFCHLYLHAGWGTYHGSSILRKHYRQSSAYSFISVNSKLLPFNQFEQLDVNAGEAQSDNTHNFVVEKCVFT